MSQGNNRNKRLLRISLVGFMCSGKTTIGKMLAKKLGWDFIDVDNEVERVEGMSIPYIFQLKGETYFRKKEKEVLLDFLNREKIIISTGGGLGADPEIMNLLKKKSLTVWLKISYESFKKRCGKDDNRPLLKREEKEIKNLFRKREETYKQAHLVVDENSPEEIVRLIINFRKDFY